MKSNKPARWLEVTSDIWMCNGLYHTNADYRTVKRWAAREWFGNTGNVCSPKDFKVKALPKG